MRQLFYLMMLLFLFSSSTTNAQNSTADELGKQLIGKWQLISFEKGKEKTDYQKGETIWTFDGKKLSVCSDDLGGRIEGKYQFRRAVLRINTTYVVKCNALCETHLPYGKLVIQSIKDDLLSITDWEDQVHYLLKRME